VKGSQAVLAVIRGTRITTTTSLIDLFTFEEVSPNVLGVNPKTNTVYVGGLTIPSNQAALAVIRGTTNTLTTTISLTDPSTGERIFPDVLGVNPTTNTVYVGGFTSPSNHAILAVIQF
jgi:hypothetical protein